MALTVIISLLTFFGVTGSILFKPSVTFKGFKISLFLIVACVGAVLLLIFNLVPINTVWERLAADASINPIKILVLFFSMTFLSVYLDEVGFFSFLAGKAVALSKKGQGTLFLIIYFLTAILTVFTSNDVVILTLTPFICYFSLNAKIDPVPFLVGEFAAANTRSMALIIGNPTNIYLATSAGITFLEYLKVMILPTVVSGVVELLLILILFRKKLKKPMTHYVSTEKIEKKADLTVGLIHLAVCLVFLVFSEYIGVPMWLVSFISALSLLLSSVIIRIVKKGGWGVLFGALKRIDFKLAPFVIAMFVIVVCFEYQGISESLGRFISNGEPTFNFGIASFFSANVINNIPMSILFSSFPNALFGSAVFKVVYASIVGSNVGAFLTPIGALAGIMFTNLTEKHGVKYGFKEFIKYGAAISIPTLFSALSVLFLILS